MTAVIVESKQQRGVSKFLGNQGLDVDDGAAVLISQPQAGERPALLHLDMPDIGFVWQQIFGEFSRLSVEPDRQVVVHSGRPHVRLVVELRIVRARPLGGNLPLGDLLNLGIEHRNCVAVEHAAP